MMRVLNGGPVVVEAGHEDALQMSRLTTICRELSDVAGQQDVLWREIRRRNPRQMNRIAAIIDRTGACGITDDVEVTGTHRKLELVVGRIKVRDRQRLRIALDDEDVMTPTTG